MACARQTATAGYSARGMRLNRIFSSPFIGPVPRVWALPMLRLVVMTLITGAFSLAHGNHGNSRLGSLLLVGLIISAVGWVACWPALFSYRKYRWILLHHRIPCPRCGYALTLPDIPVPSGDAATSICTECGFQSKTEEILSAWKRVTGPRVPPLEAFFNRSSVPISRKCADSA